ncbi:MAG: class I mannose-6-phosphate isomerase [Gemmataceae bacterium]|nr:class I mannose-6-phosphate isomerase [Gemmataceae bacterium]
MPGPDLYPLRFEPVFKGMLWGGGRLPALLGRPHPPGDPVGEAWVLSDVDGSPTRVADGDFEGATLRELIADDPAAILGPAEPADGRFPLLLKFIDARLPLSVQVHPNDDQAAAKTPGAAGKTEAWVVLEANPDTSRIYAGFKPGVTAADFRAALATGTTPGTLHSFTPRPGDCVFLEAGTVHAIGADILLFEVQQTSDTTYRLYDWGRVDAKTGKPRDLHVEDALTCADFGRGPCHPARPEVVDEAQWWREELVGCRYFRLTRHRATRPFPVGAAGHCRAVVCVGGRGSLGWHGIFWPLKAGDVILLPAAVGQAWCLAEDRDFRVLECGLPG